MCGEIINTADTASTNVPTIVMSIVLANVTSTASIISMTKKNNIKWTVIFFTRFY